eukprot:3587956-Pleurochrysis_carterae.AAC.1
MAQSLLKTCRFLTRWFLRSDEDAFEGCVWYPRTLARHSTQSAPSRATSERTAKQARRQTEMQTRATPKGLAAGATSSSVTPYGPRSAWLPQSPRRLHLELSDRLFPAKTVPSALFRAEKCLLLSARRCSTSRTCRAILCARTTRTSCAATTCARYLSGRYLTRTGA